MKNFFVQKLYIMFFMILSFFPNIAFAKDVGKILTSIVKTLLNPIAILFISATVVVFFWGMVKYIRSVGEKSKSDGRWLMVWGIVALFVMISVWRLASTLINILDLKNDAVDSIVISFNYKN